jgi:flagellar hook assembly protein FlgD
LIWDYNVPPSELITNFNKIRWNGRDQDGDEISNGVYFYKVIAKFPDKTKTITQKLAKVK